MKTIAVHLREQAERYHRLACQLDSRGDGLFLRRMAEGYLAQAERHAVEAAHANQLYAGYMPKAGIALE